MSGSVPLSAAWCGPEGSPRKLANLKLIAYFQPILSRVSEQGSDGRESRAPPDQSRRRCCSAGSSRRRRSCRSKSSSATATPSPSGTWARIAAPGVHDHARDRARRARRRGAPTWAGRDDVGEVLDGAGPQQHLPVGLAGALGEGGRDREHPRAPPGELAVELGEAQVVADRKADAVRNGRAATTSSSPGHHDLRFLQVLHARQVDVEQVDLAVRRRESPPSGPSRTEVLWTLLVARDPLRQAAQEQRDLRGVAQGPPCAGPTARRGPGPRGPARPRSGGTRSSRAGRRTWRRGGRLARPALPPSRGCVSTSAVDVIWTAAAMTRRIASHQRRLVARARPVGFGAVCRSPRPGGSPTRTGRRPGSGRRPAGARRRPCGRGRSAGRSCASSARAGRAP